MTNDPPIIWSQDMLRVTNVNTGAVLHFGEIVVSIKK